MEVDASVRLTTHLNALLANRVSVEVAATQIVADDVAHHVVDPDDLLDVDSTRAITWERALPRCLVIERTQWQLALPRPGVLGGLRGPVDLNTAALSAGAAVLASGGELGLVPIRVGRALQWRVFNATLPAPPPSPYESERMLREAVLEAARTLETLELAGGAMAGWRPPDISIWAPGYPPLQRNAIAKALRMLAAADLALSDDGGSISSWESDLRSRELRRVRDAASDALVSAVSWIKPS
ncbi:hypothetical protein [Microlunatus sp. GCM10028923]|uniref:hypothetical protein n=1 Tax=Microlunatus sp. GCM10028923 TaxID=3273400 RepID=UPI003615B681